MKMTSVSERAGILQIEKKASFAFQNIFEFTQKRNDLLVHIAPGNGKLSKGEQLLHCIKNEQQPAGGGRRHGMFQDFFHESTSLLFVIWPIV